ncbi:hypoxanthine phosphoribosyltransferase [Weissella muntiaci]|uniref:Hypoxanthine-guanine phosphoribosyltransferase n=1 Tax=Weissella muntiaci TaxID=2508881 RepID=A0A6C2C9D1_9LACO|nr:phosphoribosyltransferase family protein [Weissella muntiaci]TYC50302.1 hypoxanthine phosphoribosyltransferase [Weissella muntiaci]
MEMTLDRVVVTAEEIDRMVERVATELRQTLAGVERPLFVGVMEGSYIWMADLLRRLASDFDIESDYIDVSSYDGESSTGQVKIVQDLHTQLAGRTVVILDEVIDTGLTLQNLKANFLERGAEQVYIAVATDKRVTMTEAGVDPDFVGIRVPDEFLVGYGMDYNEHYRNLPMISVLKITE